MNFFMNFDFKNGKIKLRIITKNHTADPEIGYLTKSILKLYAYMYGPTVSQYRFYGFRSSQRPPACQGGETGRMVSKVKKQSFLRKNSHFPMKSKRFSFEI